MTTKISDKQQITLAVHIISRSSMKVIGKTWWVLAPSGSEKPWETAVFTSKIDQRTYPEAAKVGLDWNTTVALPNALYDLALFVHVVNPENGSETPVDLREAGPIRFSGPSAGPWVIRRQEASGQAVILSVSDPQQGTGGLNPLSRNLTIGNATAADVAFSAVVQAKVLPTGWEDRWWDSVPLYSSPPIDGIVRAAQSERLSIAAPPQAPMLASFPGVQFWLSVSVNGKVSDSALIGGDATFVVAPQLFRRPAAPGPVALTHIDAAVAWHLYASQTITTTITNLTGTTQVVRVWSDLAARNDPRPWVNRSAEAGPVQITLGPWSSQVVPLRAVPPKTGLWELSSWLQYKVGATFNHSDVLYLARPIMVS
jgi:hypothetical protein